MKKKIVALFMLATLALSACGGGSKTSTDSTKAAVGATADEPIEIVISHIADENHTWHKGSEKLLRKSPVEDLK